MKKIYLLTKKESELIDLRREFNQKYIEEVEATQLLLEQKNNNHCMVKIRQALSRGESVVVPKKATAPIDDIVVFIKKLLNRYKK